MPPFDPVRDAVLNSPITQSPPALARIDLPPRPSTSHTTTASPVSRRATDLAVLLNDEPRPARESPRILPRSLSGLLHDDSLSTAEPFHRTAERTSSSPPHQYFPFTFTPPPRDHPPPTPPPTRSPIFSSPSRPSTSSSTPPTKRSPERSPAAHHTPTIMPPPTIPYKPRNRVTPPTAVLTPLSQREINFYKDPDKSRLGWGLLAKKRKRVLDDDAQSPPHKKSKDVGIVVDHYNTRPEVGIKMRQDSPIIGLKNFNNWIKSVLFANFGHAVLAASPYSQAPPAGRRNGPVNRGKVLDMGCGKGGDLNKWAKARVKEYVGLDIAGVSVDQARQRHGTLKGSRFEATFAACDCYAVSLASVLDPRRLTTPFDVVSMQFCMHYAFETEDKARCMLENVSRWLREGGVFVGTIPNANQLIRRLRESSEHSFGNSIYTIRTDEPIPSNEDMPTFGLRYWFYLKDAVENVPEYIVHWENFVQLAAEYGLHVKYRKEFHDVFAEFSDHSEFGPLMERMKVVNQDGESQMDEMQWEAANIYIAFVFEKR